MTQIVVSTGEARGADDMKSFGRKFYGYLVDYWNSVLAFVSVLGIGASQVFPDIEDYFEFFAFVGLNAVVWTLIEIRHDLRTPEPESRGRVTYPSMRYARSDIIEQLSTQLTRHGVRQVHILGGRIRSIIEILREFADRLEPGGVPNRAQGLEIEVVCMSPDFLRQWPVPGDLSEDSRTDLGERFAGNVHAAVQELTDLSMRPTLRQRGVAIKVRYYHSIPAVYGYVFADDAVLWGGYTWDRDRSDVAGPSNPCYRIDAGQPDFDSVRSWLLSHMELLQAVRTERTPSR
jgi:hypothetical protein